MKLWHIALLIIILATMPLLSACDLLGIGNSGNSEREEYERKIEVIRQAQEANRKALEDQQKALQEYNEKLKEALEEYYEKYEEYQQQQLGIDITISVNQTSDNGSGSAN